MSKSSNNTVKSAPRASAAARNGVVSAFVHALASHETSGNVILQVCNAAQKWFKGEQIGDEDRKAIIADVAAERGWKGDAVKTRGSECAQVLKCYSSLLEAMPLFQQKAGMLQWTHSLALARALNKGKSVKQAVQEVASNKSSASGKGGTPQGRVAAGLKAWFKVARADKKEEILKAAKILNIVLGVKLDA